MSPRRNRPSRRGRVARGSRGQPHAAVDAPLRMRAVDTVEEWRGEPWRVRHLTGTGTPKTYRCPGCDHEIPPGVPHVVVWPVESGGLADRRHWHTGCWRARDRRSPVR